MRALLVPFAVVTLFFSSFVTLNDTPEQMVLKRGDEMTTIAGKKLVGTLMKALEKGGVSHAVSFCNTAALPLTDSLSASNNVVIKRTALKYRNPKNKPTKLEKKQLEVYETALIAKQPLEPKVIEVAKNEWLYMKPIVLQAQCQACHGIVGETIAEKEYQLIKKLYPKDKATGFKTGDLRGMWSVRIAL